MPTKQMETDQYNGRNMVKAVPTKQCLVAGQAASIDSQQRESALSAGCFSVFQLHPHAILLVLTSMLSHTLHAAVDHSTALVAHVHFTLHSTKATSLNSACAALEHLSWYHTHECTCTQCSIQQYYLSFPFVALCAVMVVL